MVLMGGVKNMFPSVKAGKVTSSPLPSLLEIELKLPAVNRLRNEHTGDIEIGNLSLPQVSRQPDVSQAVSLSEIFLGEGIVRFNSVLGGAAFISVSLAYEPQSDKSQELVNNQQNTYVRLWSVPSGELRLERRHEVDRNSPCTSDQLTFSGENISVTQSPDATLIAVTSENMIGVYEIRLKGDVPYFKWNSSYVLPENCQPCKVAFHVGSEALSIKSNFGDIDWVEIKSCVVEHLSPASNDRFRISHRKGAGALAA